MVNCMRVYRMPANPIAWALESFPADRPELVAKAADVSVQAVIDYLKKKGA